MQINKNYLYGLIILLIIATLSTIIVYAIKGIIKQDVATYNMRVEIINETGNVTKIGVSSDTFELNFGRLIYNMTNSTKILNINYNVPRKGILYLKGKGNITSLLSYHSKIILDPSKKIDVYITCMPNKLGNYSGKMDIYLVYPKNKLSEIYMELRGYYEK